MTQRPSNRCLRDWRRGIKNCIVKASSLPNHLNREKLSLQAVFKSRTEVSGEEVSSRREQSLGEGLNQWNCHGNEQTLRPAEMR